MPQPAAHLGARPRLLTTEPFSEPEVFDFPEGIGPVECVNVEHEEVVLIPRWVDCQRVTFKYGLGEEFIDVLQTLRKLGLDSTEPVSRERRVGRARDVVAAALPNPATLGDRMTGRTCAGTYVTGTGKDGQPRPTYLYHVVDNEQTMREYGSQAVVWQTAINPVVALELLDDGAWSGAGVLGPEAFPPRRSSRAWQSWARRTGSWSWRKRGTSFDRSFDASWGSAGSRRCRAASPALRTARPPRPPPSAWTREPSYPATEPQTAPPGPRSRPEPASTGDGVFSSGRGAVSELREKNYAKNGREPSMSMKPRIMPPTPNQSGNVMFAIGLDETFSLCP